MADYIDRESAIKLLTSVALEVSDSKRRAVAKCINEIEMMPAADVELVRRGRWEAVDSSYCRRTLSSVETVFCRTYRCSSCGRRTAVKGNYCPNCGARMDVEGENNDNG